MEHTPTLRAAYGVCVVRRGGDARRGRNTLARKWPWASQSVVCPARPQFLDASLRAHLLMADSWRYHFVGEHMNAAAYYVGSNGGSIMVEVYFGDNLPILEAMADASFDLIYVDPPFNTGKRQARTQIKAVHDENEGDRRGFQGKLYRTVKLGSKSFVDTFDDYLAFLEPRLSQAVRLLKPHGAFFLHIDYREVHYCKVLLDCLFGRECFMNEIIWAYDYGARSTRRWSAKHDSILWYVKDPQCYTFNYDEMDRIPYMAPGLVGAEKAARGKTPTDVWWHTIVSPHGKEKTGYPTQKPLGVIERIVKVHSSPGDRLIDFFAGSGTLGEAGARLGRDVVLVDSARDAINVMAQRLAFARPLFHGIEPPEIAATQMTLL